MTVYGIQFWIECKGGSKTADELSDALDDLIYDGNLSLGYSDHSIMGAGLFMKNAVQNNFESIRKILNEFADKIKYVSEWDYEDSSDVEWGVHILGESKKSARKSIRESNDFYFEVVFYKDVAKAKEYVKEIYNKFLKKYGYSKNDITWKLTSKGIGFSSSSENIGFDLEDYILDHMYEYGDYEFETDYELTESKTSLRKSIKEFDNIRSIRDISKKELMKYEGEKFSINFRGHNGEIWYDNHYRICYDFGNGVEGINYPSINRVIEELSYEITESKNLRKSQLKESDDIIKLMKAIYKYLKKYGDYYFYEGAVIHHYSWELSNNIILGEYDFNGVAINQTVKIYLSENYDGFYIERGYLNKGQINDIKFADTYTSSIEEMLDDVDFVCSCINNELLSIGPSKYSK